MIVYYNTYICIYYYYINKGNINNINNINIINIIIYSQFQVGQTRLEFEILNDKRRLTVAVTRSKEKLIMIGCIKSLIRYAPLVELIEIIFLEEI
jgi:hypothetical protein